MGEGKLGKLSQVFESDDKSRTSIVSRIVPSLFPVAITRFVRPSSKHFVFSEWNLYYRMVYHPTNWLKIEQYNFWRLQISERFQTGNSQLKPLLCMNGFPCHSLGLRYIKMKKKPRIPNPANSHSYSHSLGISPPLSVILPFAINKNRG